MEASQAARRLLDGHNSFISVRVEDGGSFQKKRRGMKRNE
jgi:hypothetical protein